MSIDITGLDRAAVLAALYNASRQQGMGFLHKRGAQNMTVEEAQKELDAHPGLYFDYLYGRVMKIDLHRRELDERLYDRDNGQGAAYAALKSLLTAQPEAAKGEK